MTSKPHIIDAIQQINQSAGRDWLGSFARTSLLRYLDRLEHTLEPRGRASFWVRAPETPAAVTRQPML